MAERGWRGERAGGPDAALDRPAKRHLKPGGPIPPGYTSFPVVVMAGEAIGPYSPRNLAVRLPQDNMAGWTRHALLRAVS